MTISNNTKPASRLTSLSLDLAPYPLVTTETIKARVEATNGLSSAYLDTTLSGLKHLFMK